MWSFMVWPPPKSSLGSQMKKHEIDGTHARRREEKKMQCFGGKPRKRAHLQRPRRRWDDNNKIDLIVSDWIYWRDGNKPAVSIK